jgi:hypothetical protein
MRPGKDRYGAAATAVISASSTAKSGLLVDAQRSSGKFAFIDRAVGEFDMLIAGPWPAVAVALSSVQRCRHRQCTRN